MIWVLSWCQFLYNPADQLFLRQQHGREIVRRKIFHLGNLKPRPEIAAHDSAEIDQTDVTILPRTNRPQQSLNLHMHTGLLEKFTHDRVRGLLTILKTSRGDPPFIFSIGMLEKKNTPRFIEYHRRHGNPELFSNELRPQNVNPEWQSAPDSQ